jgi:hypothetical protein
MIGTFSLLYTNVIRFKYQNSGFAKACLSLIRNHFLLAAGRAQEFEVAEVENRCEPTLKSGM